jgi:hypothetical protein
MRAKNRIFATRGQFFKRYAALFQRPILAGEQNRGICLDLPADLISALKLRFWEFFFLFAEAGFSYSLQMF